MLSSLSHEVAGTAHDATIALTYNPASQIATRTLSNDLFAWTGHGSGSTSSTVNGLNQLSVSGGTAFSYDSKGNMTSDGARTYAFSSENLLAGIAVGSSTASLGYDPAMRLYQGVEGGNATRFLFEGGDLIAEYANSSLINRYVPGPGTDEPMGTASPSGSRSWTYADERGSIVATEGSTIRINSYDEYGKPGATPTGRFGYTGLPRLNNQLHYARARFYDWNTGRFVQPDPIGYSDGMNMYGYVGGDPVNFVDPSGLGCISYKVGGGVTENGSDVVIQRGRYESACWDAGDGWGPTRYFDGVVDGGGGGGGGGSLPPVDPCAAKETPPRKGQSFSIDKNQFFSKAAEKYNQHSWPLNERGNRQSVFGGKITSPTELASRAFHLVTTRDAVPAGGLNVRITGDLAVHVGRDIRSPLPRTTYLTVIFGPPMGTRDGLPLRPAVSMHPGC